MITGLDGPEQLVISGSDIFVTNYFNGVVGEYTTSGATVNAQLITGLSNPTGIAVSGPDIFVTNFSNNTIGEYTTSGATVNASLISPGLNQPFSIAASGSDLYVEYTFNGSAGIGEYTTSGATVNAEMISGLGADGDIALSGSNVLVGLSSGAVYENYGFLVSGLDGPVGVAVENQELIPEPSTCALLGLGAAGLLFFARRRARQ